MQMNSVVWRGKGGRQTFIVALLLFMLHDFPIIGYHTPAALYAALVVMVHVTTISFLGWKKYCLCWQKTFPLTLITWLGILSTCFVELTNALLAFYSYLQIVIYYIVGYYILKSKDVSLSRILLIFLVGYFFITAITTFMGLDIFPEASRNMAHSVEEDDAALFGQYMQYNIGGFNFIYYLVLLIILLIVALRSGFANKPLIILITLVFFLTILKAQYTFGIIFAFLSLTLLFVPKHFSIRQFRIFSFSLFWLIVIAWSVLPLLFSEIAEIFDTGQVAERFVMMSDALEAGQIDVDATGDVAARALRYQMSLLSIVKSFPLGTWQNEGLGGHSYFLDNVAFYGIIGLICLIVQYKKMYSIFIKPTIKSGWVGYFYFLFFEIVALSVINTIVYTKVVAFFLPIFYVLLTYNKGLDINSRH